LRYPGSGSVAAFYAAAAAVGFAPAPSDHVVGLIIESEDWHQIIPIDHSACSLRIQNPGRTIHVDDFDRKILTIGVRGAKALDNC
jgi:hypothetical protein